jgi:hypothetical protein
VFSVSSNLTLNHSMQLHRSLLVGRTGTRTLAMCASVLALSATHAFAQGTPTSVYNVATYGAVANDGVDDLTAIKATIAAALAFTGDAVIHFPAGQYDVQALLNTGGSAFVLAATGSSNPTSVRIESGPGGPAEIVMTPSSAGGNLGCFEVRDLQNVTLTGMKIDYRLPNGTPTTFSQGTVLAVELGTRGVPNSSFVKLQVDPGYLPPEDSAVRMHAIDPATTGFRGRVANRLVSLVSPWPNEPGAYRVEHQWIHPNNDNLQVGDRLAIPDFPEGHSIFLMEDVDGVTVTDCEINAGAHMAMIVRSSTDVLVEDMRIVPGDAPFTGAMDRMVSTNRDGIHVSDCRGSLEVKDCEVVATDDDGITSHGFSFDLTGLLTTTRIQVKERKPHQSPILSGDELRFYDMGTSTYETRTVDIAIVQQAGGPTGLDVYLVKLTAPIYATVQPNVSDVHVANLETVGYNIEFTGNTCRLNSGRGIMIWGSNGTISNNTTDHTRMSGISIQNNLVLPMAPGELGTWDAAASQGVVISNNVILNAGEGDSSINTFRGGVTVYNSTRSLDTGVWLPQNWLSADLFSNIIIKDNYFEAVHGPNIIISNATEVEVTDNTFVKVNEATVGPLHATGFRPIHLTAIVDIEYVDQIVFSGNQIFLTNPANFRAIPGSPNLYVNDTANCTNVTPAIADQGFVLFP